VDFELALQRMCEGQPIVSTTTCSSSAATASTTRCPTPCVSADPGRASTDIEEQGSALVTCEVGVFKPERNACK
jgi:hypothetical protein